MGRLESHGSFVMLREVRKKATKSATISIPYLFDCKLWLTMSVFHHLGAASIFFL